MTRSKEFMVGLLVITAVAVAVVGTLYLQGTNFGRPQVEAQVLLRNVGQLNQGNAVKYLGVRIGQVEQIGVDGTAVRLLLLLDQGVVLPEDAAVILGPESLFGDWQAEIVSRAEYPRFPFYQLPPDTPPNVYPGYALPELSRLTASAEQISDNLADLSERLELAFNEETATQLASAISNLEAISLEIRELVVQQADIASSVTASADSALTEVQAASVAARRTFDRIENLVTDVQLDSIVTNIRIASSGLQKLATDVSAASGGLPQTMAAADSAFARLDRITASLESGDGTIGRLLSDSTLAVRAVDVMDQLALLLQDVRENPSRYVRLSIF